MISNIAPISPDFRKKISRGQQRSYAPQKTWSKRVVDDVMTYSIIASVFLAPAFSNYVGLPLAGLSARADLFAVCLQCLPAAAALFVKGKIAGPWTTMMPTWKARFAVLAMIGFLCAVVFDIVVNDGSGLLPLAVGWLAATAVSVASPHLARKILRSRALQMRMKTNIAVYAAGPTADQICDSIISSPQLRFAGLFDDRKSHRGIKPRHYRVLGTSEDLAASVANGQVDEVILAVQASAKARVGVLARRFDCLPVPIWVVTDEGTMDAAPSADRCAFGSITVERTQERAMYGWGMMAKAILDRVGSAILLLAMSPLFLFIASAIKFDSSGPVFFRQNRHGAVGRIFRIWKFRTMRALEDGSVVTQATKDDPRITRVGKFLRKTSLDELPQLINVVLGEMSLVGPRPHAIAHNEHYAFHVDHYSRRHRVLPGMTGWAQINGHRGECTNKDTMSDRVVHDLWYIANWSFWLDLKVLIATPVYGFMHKNAY